MKKFDIKSVILVIYLQAILIAYFLLLLPILTQTRDLAPTKVPTLQISSIGEANSLFINKGKLWTNKPEEPNLVNFAFGQTDPIVPEPQE